LLFLSGRQTTKVGVLMDIFLRIDTNLLAMAVLTFIIIMSINRLDKKTTMNRLFVLVCLLDMTELVVETASCFLNGVPGTFVYVLSNILHVVLFSVAPLLGLHWFFLVRNIFKPYRRTNKTLFFIMLLPVIVNFIVVLLSPFYGFTFTIGDGNVYSRGFWYYVTGGITFLYMLVSIVIIIANHKNVLKDEFMMIMSIFMLPVLGGIMQAIFYGALLIWSSSAMSLVIAFIFLQQRMIHLDSLTGCWTRDSLLYFISLRLNRKDGGFGAIYFDIDKLKQINDSYGHLEGDNAIKKAVSFVKMELGPGDIIARMGGDEFVVIVDSGSPEKISKILARIKENFADYNRRMENKYVLDCSFGADVYSPNYVNFEQFLNNVDTLMYQHKER